MSERLNQKHYWYWLACLKGLSGKRMEQLLHYFQTPKQIFSAKKEEFSIFKLPKEVILELCNTREEEKILSEYDKLLKKDIYFVTIEEETYPKSLKLIYEAPYFLFFRGKLPSENKPSIAIIGARKCSEYGKEMAFYFAEELARRGIQIISGLASGIDGYAHQGALLGKGETFGILGSGIDVCYPLGHCNLYWDMLKQGGILSEYAPGTPGFPHHFPMRNRLISGCSDGIFVIEAKKRSGSFITVERGLEQGKDIFALPGKPHDFLSEGCNILIQNGAKLVMKIEDIIEELEFLYPSYFTKINNQKKDVFNRREDNSLKKALARDEKIVYANLSLQPKYLETLLQETGMEVGHLTEILLGMETKGYIKQSGRSAYVKAGNV